MHPKPLSKSGGVLFQRMTRRDFITQSFFTAIGIIALKPMFFQDSEEIPSDGNATLCIKKFSYAVDNRLTGKPIGEIVAAMGRSFIGTDYQENTLDRGEEERLVLNLQGLDCVTLCENSLALARCIKLRTTTFDGFCRQLQFIRYRSGMIDTYASRLHYFSDWIFDNEQKYVVKDITSDVGGENTEMVSRNIHFMTTHRELYRQLVDSTMFSAIRKKEQEIGTRMFRYIPKGMIKKISSNIHHGDIIAFTTTIEGMDISHTGIAYRPPGAGRSGVHLLHAPVPGKKVHITELSLHDYCAKNSRQTGIIIARPLEPYSS